MFSFIEIGKDALADNASVHTQDTRKANYKHNV